MPLILAFEVDPEDITVEVNRTNVTLNCTTHVGNGIFDTSIWEIYLRNGTYWTVTSADESVHRNRLGCVTRYVTLIVLFTLLIIFRELEFVHSSRSLRILKVQAFHSGVYRCKATRILGGTCIYYSENATVTVRGTSYICVLFVSKFSMVN